MMTSTPALTGPAAPPAAGGPPQSLVVLVHGYGADGRDLISLSGEWRDLLPHTAFIAPNAPFPCEAGPFGYQWFSLADRSPERLTAGVQTAAPILRTFLESQRASLGLPWSRVALVGFSQGTMMSLFVALRLPEPLAGVLGYSGALLGGERLGTEMTARPPLLLVHGDADEVVPLQATLVAGQVLAGLGVPVEVHQRPGLGHGIDGVGLALGGRFLANRLAAGGGQETP